jgi:hypothetical protein
MNRSSKWLCMMMMVATDRSTCSVDKSLVIKQGRPETQIVWIVAICYINKIKFTGRKSKYQMKAKRLGVAATARPDSNGMKVPDDNARHDQSSSCGFVPDFASRSGTTPAAAFASFSSTMAAAAAAAGWSGGGTPTTPQRAFFFGSQCGGSGVDGSIGGWLTRPTLKYVS